MFRSSYLALVLSVVLLLDGCSAVFWLLGQRDNPRPQIHQVSEVVAHDGGVLVYRGGNTHHPTNWDMGGPSYAGFSGTVDGHTWQHQSLQGFLLGMASTPEACWVLMFAQGGSPLPGLPRVPYGGWLYRWRQGNWSFEGRFPIRNNTPRSLLMAKGTPAAVAPEGNTWVWQQGEWVERTGAWASYGRDSTYQSVAALAVKDRELLAMTYVNEHLVPRWNTIQIMRLALDGTSNWTPLGPRLTWQGGGMSSDGARIYLGDGRRLMSLAPPYTRWQLERAEPGFGPPGRPDEPATRIGTMPTSWMFWKVGTGLYHHPWGLRQGGSLRLATGGQWTPVPVPPGTYALWRDQVYVVDRLLERGDRPRLRRGPLASLARGIAGWETVPLEAFTL